MKLVRFGVLNFHNADASQIQELEVESTIPHPEYQQKLYNHDIAILVLKEKVTFNKHVRPVCLEEVLNLTDANIIGAGWGKLVSNSTQEGDLKHVELVYFDQARCKEIYKNHPELPKVIDDNFYICAGPKHENKDLCRVT